MGHMAHAHFSLYFTILVKEFATFSIDIKTKISKLHIHYN